MESVHFPAQCCLCMGPKETTTSITKTKNFGTFSRTWSIEVPLCAKCKQARQRPAMIAAIVALCVCAALGAAIGASIQEGRHALGNGIGGAIVGGIAGALIAGFAVSSAEPARLELWLVNGDWQLSRIVFENAEYQELFNAANRRL